MNGTTGTNNRKVKKDHDSSHATDNNRNKPPIAATTVLGAEMANDRSAWRGIHSWRDLVTGCDPGKHVIKCCRWPFIY